MFRRFSCVSAILCGALAPTFALAQAGSVVDVCTGLGISLPALQPVAGAATGLLGGLLDPVLNGIVGDVNVNLRDALSGRNIGVTAIDQNGNLVTAPGQCGLRASTITVDSGGGVSVGGGRINGLGGAANPTSQAVDPNAIAIGNGASTTAAATGAVSIGLRGAVTGADGVSIGRDASVSATGGVALGSGSVALRPGLNGATEAFSGVAVGSTHGALSVGAPGAERQIAHVAGGTQDTDAVNLRQLRATATNISVSLGGGATFNASGQYIGPTFTLRSGVYTDVATALTALDNASGVIAGDNTSARPAASASGADSLAAGYGSRATGERATALGTQAEASGVGSVALGAGASASGDGSVAIGPDARATRPGQVAIGGAGSTYTLAGLTSPASRAAQSGPTQVVTTDAAGNLAAMPIDVGGLDRRVTDLGAYAIESRREARRGVAAAMAMTAPSMPSAPGRTSWAGNTATYKGEWAAGFGLAHRLPTKTPVALNAGVSLVGGGFGGARFGLAGEF